MMDGGEVMYCLLDEIEVGVDDVKVILFELVEVVW